MFPLRAHPVSSACSTWVAARMDLFAVQWVSGASTPDVASGARRHHVVLRGLLLRSGGSAAHACFGTVVAALAAASQSNSRSHSRPHWPGWPPSTCVFELDTYFFLTRFFTAAPVGPPQKPCLKGGPRAPGVITSRPPHAGWRAPQKRAGCGRQAR